jgi:hypothetical protein
VKSYKNFFKKQKLFNPQIGIKIKILLESMKRCDAIHSGMSLPTFRGNRHHVVENRSFHSHCYENLKSNMELVCLNTIPFSSYYNLIL